MENLKYRYAPELPEPFRCRVPLPGTVQAYVTNGVLRESVAPAPGVTISSLSDGIGYFYNVEKGSVQKGNVQIISFRDATNTDDLSFSNTIVFGEGSSSDIILCTHTLSLDSFKTDEQINIKVERGAKAEFVVMQNEHNNSVHSVRFNIDIEEEGQIKINVVTLHGALLENDFIVNLLGERAYCELNGTYLVDGKQVIKTDVLMNHQVPGCVSKQLFKGILDNEARATFTGRVVVYKDAQKTEAYQANHNLLISPQAKVYAQPQLEIYADDVKCSHGATSGRLDENALFYLRSRGIGLYEAKLNLQQAFVYDVLEHISNDQLRKRLSDLVESRLRGEFGRCANCSLNCC